MFLRGLSRDAATFAPLSPTQPPGALERTFGAGFLLVDGALVVEGCYAQLLALVAPETWRGTATYHAAQLVLNHYFAGRQTLVGWSYDFVLPMAKAIRACACVDARALHFAGPVKPWMPDAMLQWAHGDPEHVPRNVFKLWYDTYLGCLADAHLRSAQRPGALEVHAQRLLHARHPGSVSV